MTTRVRSVALSAVADMSTVSGRWRLRSAAVVARLGPPVAAVILASILASCSNSGTSSGGSGSPPTTTSSATSSVAAGPVVTVIAHGTTVTVVMGTRIRLEIPSQVTGRPTTSNPGVVRLGGWTAAPCPPAHCYALVAVAPGKAELGASSPSGCAPNGTCYMGAGIDQRFLVTPAGSS